MGGLALGGGAVAGVMSTQASERALAATGRDAFRDEVAFSETMGLVADGLFVAGGALAITGVALLVLQSGTEQAAVVVPSLGPGRVGLTGLVRF